MIHRPFFVLISGARDSPMDILGSAFQASYSISDALLWIDGPSFLPPTSLFATVTQQQGSKSVTSYVTSSLSPPPPLESIDSLTSTPSSCVPDSNGLRVTIRGSVSIQLTVYSSYLDLGAYASDSCGQSLDVAVSGLPPSNFTSSTTSVIVSYSVVDSANNSAVATRSISVYDPCGPSERTCDSSGVCSQYGGNCNPAFLSQLSTDGILVSSLRPGQTNVSSSPPPPKLEQKPPVITISGEGTPFVSASGETGLTTTVLVGTLCVDAGQIRLPLIYPPYSLTLS